MTILGNIGEMHPSGRPSDEAILALWCAGRNTLDIAREVGVPESYIYNRLPRVLERHRQDNAWDKSA